MSDAALPVDPGPFAHHLQQGLELLRPHEHVNVGESAGQIVRVGSHHTTHKGNDALGLLLFQGGHPGQVAGYFVFSALADDTGIEHNDIGVGRSFHLLDAHLLQRGAQPFGIRGVHLTSDGPEVVTVHGKGLNLALGFELKRKSFDLW